MLMLCSCLNAQEASFDIRRTETQRQSEIASALREMGEDLTEMDKVNFMDGLKKGEYNFKRLYQARWKALGMPAKLEKAVSDAFNEKTQSLMFGTRGLQLGTNTGNVVNDIQEAIAFKFAEPYDDFLRDLEEKWGESLETEISEFYHRASIMLIASDRNPMIKAWIRQNTTAQDNGAKIISDVSEQLSAKYPDLKLSGASAAGGIALIFRKQLVNYLARYAGKTALFKKAATSAIGKAIGRTLPVIGPVLLAWSLYDVASIAWNAEDDVRKMLLERNQVMYSREMPAVYWDVMEPYVMDVLVSSYGLLQNSKRQAAEFAGDERIIELCEGMDENEAVRLTERISSAVEVLGRDRYDYIIDNFGKRIKDASPQNFRKLLTVLKQDNIEQAKQWLDLAGSEYYDWLSRFPREIWENFSPNKDSLELLQWMTSKLTPSAINTASKLIPSDLKYIASQIPERYVPQLFGNQDADSQAIHYELTRLAELPDREDRKPWQSVWEFRWAQYKTYIIGALGLLFLAVLAKMLVPLFMRKKPAEVTINLQSPVPVSGSPAVSAKKYHVKLKISPDFIDEARRTQWDFSQKLLPSDDGTYLFTSELENLERISWWINEHRENIEVLEPEELRRIDNE